MNYEKSCGAIVYTEIDQDRLYLLIRHMNGGHWAFAKGHVEEGETEIETALREIDEETGLKVSLDSQFRESNSYQPKEGVTKEVIYFVAKADSQEVKRQEIEVLEAQWLPYDQAQELLTYDNDKLLLQKAQAYLSN